IANHRHWVGNQWNDSDRAKSDANGGGHAHAGAMIYLGGAWPEKYRGQLFMNNIHGARLNLDRLTPKGSGYVGDGEPDFLKANDWYVRQARRLLMERTAAKKLDVKVRETLEKMAFEHKDATRRLRGLWALHVTGGLSEKQIMTGLEHTCQHVRSWTIQLACE